MSVRDVFTSACCHNECNNDKHRYKFNQNKLFPESYIIKLESCKTLDQCFVKDGVYYKTKSNCAVQVTVPSKSIHNDDSCVRTILIIPPDTRVDFDTNRTGRAERAQAGIAWQGPFEWLSTDAGKHDRHSNRS